MKPSFESAFAIGQRVYIHIQGAKIFGHVRCVTFTSSKVRYAVCVLGDETTLHNIDSALVFSEPNSEIVPMPEDNYS